MRKEKDFRRRALLLLTTMALMVVGYTGAALAAESELDESNEAENPGGSGIEGSDALGLTFTAEKTSPATAS